MEQSNELLTNEVVGQSIPPDILERNGNDAEIKFGELNQHDNRLGKDEERRRETINQPEEQPMEDLETKERRLLKTNVTVENMDNLERIVWDALNCDDIEKLREVIEKGPVSAALTICEKMSKAVFHNSLKCLEYILEIYDQLHDSSRSKIIWIDGNSPLFTITKKCCWAAMRIVQKHPSFIKDVVDEPGSDGSTPLLVAVKRNHIEVVKWLMNNSGMKLEIERRNRKGETAIYLAALNGQADVIKEMLERYASSKEHRESLLTNEDLYGEGHSILYPASQSGNPNILDILMEEEQASLCLQKELQHFDSVKFLGNVCVSGCEKLLNVILELENDLLIGDWKDENGATPLMR